MATTDTATFCATLVDEWHRHGVTAAFVAPGSRSTPLALALAADDRFAVHVFHDERSASFAALGHGLATGRPAVVLCTSGTAATHFHGAVVEADLSSVPLLVCTADRPPELWSVGAPQTIDQTHLYGRAVRWFAEPGPPDAVTAGSWRSLASQAAAEALGWSGRPGPAHLNLSFRDPLVGEPGSLPPGRPDGAPWHRVGTSASVVDDADIDRVAATLVDGSGAVDGVIVAGAGTPDPKAVAALADRLGWPVLADHRSGCRDAGNAIRYFDGLLRTDAFSRWRPPVVIRFGEALSSKVLGQWIDRSVSAGTIVVWIGAGTRWSDPERAAAVLLDDPTAPSGLADRLPTDVVPSSAAARWRKADDAAAAAVAETLAGAELDEIQVATAVVESVPPGGALVVSSSMPVRDVEWYGPNRADLDVYANRGANGIDGVVSTAIGVALSGRPTTVLIGDVAFLHDSTALVALALRAIDLRIVVVDNDGGGIFSFLPQATELDRHRYEQLFGTPHGTDLASLAAAHHLPVEPWPPAGPPSGVTVTFATTDRAANADLHRRINAAIAAAVDGAPTA